MKIRINHDVHPMVVKKHYFLVFVLWFTPVHELGHIVICWFLNSEVTYINWWGSIRHVVNPLDWIHHVWEFVTCGVPILFILLWGWFNVHRSKNLVDAV